MVERQREERGTGTAETGMTGTGTEETWTGRKGYGGSYDVRRDRNGRMVGWRTTTGRRTRRGEREIERSKEEGEPTR